MAAPTYLGSGTFTSTASGNLTLPLPASTAVNDILLACIVTDFGEDVAAPSGWAHVTNSPAGPGAAPKLHVLWKRHDGSESSPVFTDSWTQGVAGRTHAFRGCKTAGNPWNVTASANSGSFTTAVTAPSVTTTVAECLIVICYAGTDSSTAVSIGSFANANLTSITERADNGNTGHGYGSLGLALATGIKTTAGSTGTSTATTNVNANDAVLTIALEPGGVAEEDADASATTAVTVTSNAPSKGISTRPLVIG